jgi:hypothetical protein
MLISRMIDGQFLAYERVIPKGNDKHIEFERDRLTNAVKRVALLSNARCARSRCRSKRARRDVERLISAKGNAAGRIQRQLDADLLQRAIRPDFSLRWRPTSSLELKHEVSQAVMKPVGAEGYDYTYVIDAGLNIVRMQQTC